MQKGDEKKSSWLLKLIIFLGIILLGLIAAAIARETIKKQQVQSEIDQLKAEAAKIERENSDLSDRIAYFQSKDYQEKEAKDKLNLQNPGENVVIVKPNAENKAVPVEDTPSNDKKLVVRTSNIQKWWDYFFK